jgi:pimeloyl-ACP methyl ester carboxylesterase
LGTFGASEDERLSILAGDAGRKQREHGPFASEFSSTVSASPNQFAGASNPSAPHPLLLLHGFLGDGSATRVGTWNQTIHFFTNTLHWTYGGELYHLASELTPTRVDRAGHCAHPEVIAFSGQTVGDISNCNDDRTIITATPPVFFTAGFGNNIGNYEFTTKGLTHQGDEVAAFVQKLIDDFVPAPFVIIAHSNGGLAARDYVTRQSADPRSIVPITKLITYGTPHRGADVQKFVQNAKTPVTVAACGPFPTEECQNNIASLISSLESSDAAADASFTCQPPDTPASRVTYPSTFLNALSAREWPSPGPNLVAIVGTSTANVPFSPLDFGDRRTIDDCHSAKWDGLVPIDSADITRIENPPPVSTARAFQTDRNHVQEGSDVPAILCGLDDNCAEFRVLSPVDIELRTPSGHEMARAVSSIPGASYMTIPEDDGHEGATVLIPFPEGGQYAIQATPKPGALPTDTFTITLTQNGVTTTIADHVMIQNIPPDGFHAHVNSRPFANAGADQTVECAGPDGTPVILNGSQSGDQDRDLLSYLWTNAQGNVLGRAPILTVQAHMGVQTYNLAVTDPSGLTATAQTHVTVRDTTPPSISLPSPQVTLVVNSAPIARSLLGLPSPTVTDACDPSPHVTDDAPATFSTGTYPITFTATDASGNSSRIRLVVNLHLKLTLLKAEAVVTQFRASRSDLFAAEVTFQLGSGNDGINPAVDSFHFLVTSGNIRLPIDLPLSTFRRLPGGALVFSGPINSLPTEIAIKPLSTGKYVLVLAVSRTSLAGFINPVSLSLTIGNDTGQVTANALVLKK